MSLLRSWLSCRGPTRRITASIASWRSHSDDTTKNIIVSDLPDVVIPQASIEEFVFENTNQWPNHVAMESAFTGQSCTFDEMRRSVSYLSRSLRKKLNLQKGDVVGLLLPNCVQFTSVVLGALRADLIVTLFNPISTAHEISIQLHDSQTKVLITLTILHPLAKSAIALSKDQIKIMAIKIMPTESLPEGAINYDEFIEKNDYPDVPPVNVEDIAVMPYSSGTTGLPKGVELTHRNIVSNLCQLHMDELHEPTGDHQDTHPAVLPMFHIYGLVVLGFNSLRNGVKTVTLPFFKPELYIGTLREYHPDVLYVAPPIILFLAVHSAVKAEDLQSIRAIYCGSAPLGSLDEERFLTKANKDIEIIQGYGLTETSPVVTMMRRDLKKIPSCGGSVGRPASNTQVKIIDGDHPTRSGFGPNQRGELVVKGPQVMKGYRNRPEETKEVFTPDGWFRTGDVCYYNEDQLFFITDRVKELIKVKGFQVAPAELEEVIRDFPGVADVGVIGIPHATKGEVPRAYVVEEPGKKVDIEKLNEYLKENLASYKQLKGGVEIVDTIPKNVVGKILRRQLKQWYEESQKKK